MVAEGRSTLAVALVLVGSLGTLAAGCGNPLPGTLLGTYQVNATATTNSCGLGAPSQYQFDVQISETTTPPPEALHWSWLTNTPIASGPLSAVSSTDPSLQATLTASQSANVDGVDGGAGPCTMERDDTLVVTLAAGTPPDTFTGTMGYTFSATSGADCTDQLAASGGMYAALPCTVTYTIAAKRQ
jgi:hypothetical protein